MIAVSTSTSSLGGIYESEGDVVGDKLSFFGRKNNGYRSLVYICVADSIFLFPKQRETGQKIYVVIFFSLFLCCA